VRFELHQDFAAHAPADVAAAYADPGLYGAMVDLPFVGTPTTLRHGLDGAITEVSVRYAVQVELPSAARVFVDPSRLTFVEHVRLAADGNGTFHVEPDHYERLLRFAGTYRVGAGVHGGTRRSVAGDLRVDLGWKGRLVEADVTRVIANGLRDALHAQVAVVERYLG